MTLEFAEPPPDSAPQRMPERVPSPLELARTVRPAPNAGDEQRQLECLACERRTPHERGPATHGRDGTLLVQWWNCTVCQEGRTVG